MIAYFRSYWTFPSINYIKFSYLLFLISWIQFHYIFVEKASICRPALYARSTLRERICVRVHQKGCLNLQPCHDIFFNTSCFVLLRIFSFCCSYHFARDGQNILFESWLVYFAWEQRQITLRCLTRNFSYCETRLLWMVKNLMT